MISAQRRKRAKVAFLEAFQRSSQTPGHCLEGNIFDQHVVRDASGRPTTIGGLFQVSDTLSRQFAEEAHKACYPLALEFSVEKNDLELVPDSDCVPIGLEIKKIEEDDARYVDSDVAGYDDSQWWKGNQYVYEELVLSADTFRWHFFNVLSSSLVQARWTPNLRMMYTAVVCRNCGGRSNGSHCLNAIGETPDFTLLDWYDENKDLEGQDRVARYLTPLRYILFQVWHAEQAVLAATNGKLRYESLEDRWDVERRDGGGITPVLAQLLSSIHMHNMAERFSGFAVNDTRNWFRYTTDDSKHYYLDVGTVPVLAVVTYPPDQPEDPDIAAEPVLHKMLMDKMLTDDDRDTYGMEWEQILDVFHRTRPKDLDFRRFPDQVFAIRKFGLKPTLPGYTRLLLEHFEADNLFAFDSVPVAKTKSAKESKVTADDVEDALGRVDDELAQAKSRGALSTTEEFALNGVLARKLPEVEDVVLDHLVATASEQASKGEAKGAPSQQAEEVKTSYRRSAEYYALHGEPSLADKYARSSRSKSHRERTRAVEDDSAKVFLL